MSLYFISGVSGSGKSSLVHELRSRGFEAYDTDDDAFSKWQHKKTGYIHPKSSVKAADRTPEFLEQHAWNVPRGEAEELAVKAHEQTIFLCGVADNENELDDLFAATFALAIDDETLKHRLLNRTNNDWGKQPHELEISLGLNKRLMDRYKTSAHIVVDANKPIHAIADEIVNHVKELENGR